MPSSRHSTDTEVSRFTIAAWARPTAQTENDVGRLALNRLEQGRDVLADVMIGGATTVLRRHTVIFCDRDGHDFMSLHRVLLQNGLAQRA